MTLVTSDFGCVCHHAENERKFAVRVRDDDDSDDDSDREPRHSHDS